MKKFAVFLLLLGLSGCSSLITREQPVDLAKNAESQSVIVPDLHQEFRQVDDHSWQEIQVGDSSLTVEVVNTDTSITQGLSGRSEIGADGMLFVFSQAQNVSFWMKEMNFDLDLIWIADGEVIGVTKSVSHPDPGTPLTALPIYAPPAPVDLVLEVEAGKASSLGIQTGSVFKLSPAINPSGER